MGRRRQPACVWNVHLLLLTEGQRSQWHKVDAVEIWHFYSGAPLKLRVSETETGPVKSMVLGSDLTVGEVPQGIVPKNAWQSAETTGAWTLVGCTVSPGFRFEGFELAPDGFDIT